MYSTACILRPGFEPRALRPCGPGSGSARPARPPCSTSCPAAPPSPLGGSVPKFFSAENGSFEWMETRPSSNHIFSFFPANCSLFFQHLAFFSTSFSWSLFFFSHFVTPLKFGFRFFSVWSDSKPVHQKKRIIQQNKDRNNWQRLTVFRNTSTSRHNGVGKKLRDAFH